MVVQGCGGWVVVGWGVVWGCGGGWGCAMRAVAVAVAVVGWLVVVVGGWGGGVGARCWRCWMGWLVLFG